MLTRHAAARTRQRAISPLIIDWLMAFGTAIPQAGGAEVLVFDKKARRRLESACGRRPINRLADQLDAYLVLGVNGQVITTGHRDQRVRRR